MSSRLLPSELICHHEVSLRGQFWIFVCWQTRITTHALNDGDTNQDTLSLRPKLRMQRYFISKLRLWKFSMPVKSDGKIPTLLVGYRGSSAGCNSTTEKGRWSSSLSGWWFQQFFIFHNIWDNPSHWLSYFSRWLKPPTSYSYYWTGFWYVWDHPACKKRPKLTK